MSNKTTTRVIQKILQEIASDNPSNWGGWQGGFPGSGTPLKGLKGGAKDDTGPQRTSAAFRAGRGTFKLSGKKTMVIFAPTLKQSENKLDVKNPTISPTDMPAKKGRTERQVQEQQVALSNQVVQRYTLMHEKGDVLGGLIAKGVSHLLKQAFRKPKPATKTKEVKANPLKTPKPPKPPTQAQQKQADLDKSNADFDAWKKKKADMTATFKQAYEKGVGNDINPMKVKLDVAKARQANPLKQPSTPEPAAPAEKPRVRVKAVSRPVEAPKPATPTLKPRMSSSEFQSYLKQTKLDPGKIKSGRGVANEERIQDRTIRVINKILHERHQKRPIKNEDVAPINVMAHSSSTHGTGNIDTYDPLLRKQKRRWKTTRGIV